MPCWYPPLPRSDMRIAVRQEVDPKGDASALSRSHVALGCAASSRYGPLGDSLPPKPHLTAQAAHTTTFVGVPAASNTTPSCAWPRCKRADTAQREDCSTSLAALSRPRAADTTLGKGSHSQVSLRGASRPLARP